MKAWPIDPLDFRNFKLEVSEKLPQGLTLIVIIEEEEEDDKRCLLLLLFSRSPSRVSHCVVAKTYDPHALLVVYGFVSW